MYCSFNSKIYKFHKVAGDKLDYFTLHDNFFMNGIAVLFAIPYVIITTLYRVYSILYHCTFKPYHLFSKQNRLLKKDFESQMSLVKEEDLEVYKDWYKLFRHSTFISMFNVYVHEMYHFIPSVILKGFTTLRWDKYARIDVYYEDDTLKHKAASHHAHVLFNGGDSALSTKLICGAPLLIPLFGIPITLLIAFYFKMPILLMCTAFWAYWMISEWNNGLSLSDSDKERFHKLLINQWLIAVYKLSINIKNKILKIMKNYFGWIFNDGPHTVGFLVALALFIVGIKEVFFTQDQGYGVMVLWLIAGGGIWLSQLLIWLKLKRDPRYTYNAEEHQWELKNGNNDLDL